MEKECAAFLMTNSCILSRFWTWTSHLKIFLGLWLDLDWVLKIQHWIWIEDIWQSAQLWLQNVCKRCTRIETVKKKVPTRATCLWLFHSTACRTFGSASGHFSRMSSRKNLRKKASSSVIDGRTEVNHRTGLSGQSIALSLVGSIEAR